MSSTQSMTVRSGIGPEFKGSTLLAIVILVVVTGLSLFFFTDS
jgi:hypothetical protein